MDAFVACSARSLASKAASSHGFLYSASYRYGGRRHILTRYSQKVLFGTSASVASSSPPVLPVPTTADCRSHGRGGGPGRSSDSGLISLHALLSTEHKSRKPRHNDDFAVTAGAGRLLSYLPRLEPAPATEFVAGKDEHLGGINAPLTRQPGRGWRSPFLPGPNG